MGNGTLDLFAALNWPRMKCSRRSPNRSTTNDFIKFLNLIKRNVPAELDVDIVLDNLSTQKALKCTVGYCATCGSASISRRDTGHG